VHGLTELRNGATRAATGSTRSAWIIDVPLVDDICKSENDERRVDAVELIEFARAYGVPITFFYE
jgi:hypothetical protein